jgi:hypothetical protein
VDCGGEAWYRFSEVLEVHEGLGVLPARYAGPAIRIVSSPTPQQAAVEAERDSADGLAGRICAAAVLTARSEGRFLELVGELDAIGALRSAPP